MGLETATYINELNEEWPLPDDPIREADDHMRLIKSTIKTTFPNITGEVTTTQAELNLLVGATAFPSPGGLDTYVQYNSGGVFAGSSNMVFDGTELQVAALAVTGLTTIGIDDASASGIARAGDQGSLFLSGGTGETVGARIELFGESNVSTPGNFHAAVGTDDDFLTWDNSLGALRANVGAGASKDVGFILTDSEHLFDTDAFLIRSSESGDPTAGGSIIASITFESSDPNGFGEIGYRTGPSDQLDIVNYAYDADLNIFVTNGTTFTSIYGLTLNSEALALNTNVGGFPETIFDTDSSGAAVVADASFTIYSQLQLDQYITQYAGGTPTDGHVLTWVSANSRAEFQPGGGGGGGLFSEDGSNNIVGGSGAAPSITTGARNFVGGSGAASSLSSGIQNVIIGHEAGEDIGAGDESVLIGYRAGYNASTDQNVAIGSRSLGGNTTAGLTGNENVAVGYQALTNVNATADQNVAVGNFTLALIGNGDRNTAVGYNAGFALGAASVGNVLIGNGAGPTSVGAVESNQLWINNAQSDTPLIKGDFTAGTLTINGDLTVTGSVEGASGTVTGIDETNYEETTPYLQFERAGLNYDNLIFSTDSLNPSTWVTKDGLSGGYQFGFGTGGSNTQLGITGQTDYVQFTARVNGNTGNRGFRFDTDPFTAGGAKYEFLQDGAAMIEFIPGQVTLENYVFDTDQAVGAGTDDYVLTYDQGTGLISLEPAAGGGGTPGGVDTNIQYNNAGAFGGFGGWDGTKFSLDTTEKFNINSQAADAVNLTADSGSVQIGNVGGLHIGIDRNTIQAKSNGTTAGTLNINNFGGDVNFGNGIALTGMFINTPSLTVGGWNFDSTQDPGASEDNWVMTYDFSTDRIRLAAPSGGGSPGGSDTQVQYNNGGVFGGIAEMTYDDGSGNIEFTSEIIEFTNTLGAIILKDSNNSGTGVGNRILMRDSVNFNVGNIGYIDGDDSLQIQNAIGDIKLETNNTIAATVDGSQVVDFANRPTVGAESLAYVSELGGGGNQFTVVNVTTTAQTIASFDAAMVDDDTAGSTVTITLPAGSTDSQVLVKKLGTTANVIIDGDSAETIDGNATLTLTAQYSSATLIWNGTEWSII